MWIVIDKKQAFIRNKLSAPKGIYYITICSLCKYFIKCWNATLEFLLYIFTLIRLLTSSKSHEKGMARHFCHFLYDDDIVGLMCSFQRQKWIFPHPFWNTVPPQAVLQCKNKGTSNAAQKKSSNKKYFLPLRFTVLRRNSIEQIATWSVDQSQPLDWFRENNEHMFWCTSDAPAVCCVIKALKVN